MDHPWGRNLARLRKAQALKTGERWPRARVAKEAGMTATTYGRIENGGATRTEKLEALARFYEVTLAELFLPIDDRSLRQTNPDIATTSAMGHTTSPTVQSTHQKVALHDVAGAVSAESLLAFANGIIAAASTLASSATTAIARSGTASPHRTIQGTGKTTPSRGKRGA